MKRCKDCKWCFGHYKEICICLLPAWLDAQECVKSAKYYTRKWWKVWAPKVLLITLALLLGGCSGWSAKRTDYPDGRVVVMASQWQCLTDSQRARMKFKIPGLGSAEVGTSILDAESIAAIGKVLAEILEPRWLIAKEVKP